MDASSRSVLLVTVILLAAAMGACRAVSPVSPDPVDDAIGYRGIWFTLGQFYDHGDKYSGGLGTYTAKHRPVAIHAPAADKTFFVYGGTTDLGQRHLLNMVSYYDHASGTVPRPVVVHDKQGVDDPHDNASLSLDAEGHVWIFVSGRARARPGFIYRSSAPYDISSFDRLVEDEFAYPQPWWLPGHGFVFLFTRYTDGRELYWRTSPNGSSWSETRKLVEGGHYQVSATSGDRLGTAFDTHIPHGNVDARTNLYYLQTDDGGRTWTTADGRELTPPLDDVDNAALVRDYRSEDRLVYLNDLAFDADGNPVVLYVTSRDHRPGPTGMPRRVTVAHWNGAEWLHHDVTGTLHNYDVGSLFVEDDGTWRIVGPYLAGPQHWGTGGEIGVWTSRDQGATWTMTGRITRDSPRNHAYVRRPVDADPEFYFFWADGNPDTLSVSRLYYGSRDGDVQVLPYSMRSRFATPSRMDRY